MVRCVCCSVALLVAVVGGSFLVPILTIDVRRILSDYRLLSVGHGVLWVGWGLALLLLYYDSP